VASRFSHAFGQEMVAAITKKVSTSRHDALRANAVLLKAKKILFY
jgi:hypothetical protein